MKYFTLFLFATYVAHSQGLWTAASCNYADVNSVVNGPRHVVNDGDIIRIPSGSCIWSTQLIVPDRVGIQFIGSGVPNTQPVPLGASASCTNTQITPATNGSLFQMTPTMGNPLSRISCMKITPPAMGTNLSPIFIVTGAVGASTGGCNAQGCPSFRLDNITIPSAWADAGVSDATFAVLSNVFGVADHNNVGDTQPSTLNGVDLLNVGLGRWKGVGGNGDNSWATADTFGTNQAFYLESNKFVWAFGTDVDTPGPDYGGGRFVCRFNNFNPVTLASSCTNHGTDTNARNRSGRQAEIYSNVFSCVSGGISCAGIIAGRGGAWLAFDNSFSGGTDTLANIYFSLNVQRPWRPQNPFGSCSGDSPWDNNDSTFTTLGPFTVTNPNPSGTTTLTFGGTPFMGQNFAPGGQFYSAVDITQTVSMGPVGNHPGIPILSNTNNTLTTSVSMCSSDGSTCPAVGDSIDIKRLNTCMDASARGGPGLLVTNDTTPVLQSTGNPGNVADPLDPVYEANNSGAPANGKGGGDPGIIANRDFYFESVNQGAQTSTTSPFNGTSGSGHGTFANRPTSCTPGNAAGVSGVGYWATDQRVLYTCFTTNQGGCASVTGGFWCSHYSPYQYPHPLTISSNTGVAGVLRHSRFSALLLAGAVAAAHAGTTAAAGTSTR